MRLTEQPPGIEEAEEAALELERTIGAPPFVASPPTSTGSERRRGARASALGLHGSPFANAMVTARGTVEAFVDEVVERHATPLR